MRENIKNELVNEAIDLLQDATSNRIGLAILLLNTAREIMLFEYSQERAEMEQQRLRDYIKRTQSWYLPIPRLCFK